MPDYTGFFHKNIHRLPQAEPFLPFDNPTFGNPTFEDAACRVLIARLSPFRDVDRSLPHLFLFHEVRRALPDAYIDLAFFPTAAQREFFERESIPFLIGTQSLRSTEEFDLVLISSAYTLELINLPYLLLRSGIPLFASQRGPEWPAILLGGSNAMAAQAVIGEDGDSLVDGIFFGEGEGLVGELASWQVSKYASQPTNQPANKHLLLKQTAEQIPGFWAAGLSHKTTKAICKPEAGFLPMDYPILNTPEAHTAHLQITHGCPAFCSFCFEGYDRKPYRELPLAGVLDAARQIKQAQGVEEVSLYSFNFNTHGDILPLLLELNRLFERVSLSSQRADILQHTPVLLEAEVAADKREFTLGIEGISARQRAFLHKSLLKEDITALLERLLRQPIRRIKLFYVLTGHETDEDIAEFREFVRWLKETCRAQEKKPRVIFSAGLLIRMPRTPLQYDRLFLDEADWKQIIGPVKSACETNGFEFRLAFDWAAYCTSQVLALGGHWLAKPIVALAQKGYYFDTTLLPGYWDALQEWMKKAGQWNDEFLGEKGPDYSFPLAFVASNVPADFLYRQYQETLSSTDSGYCLGSHDAPGRCLGCGACADEAQRRAIIQHQIHQVERSEYLPRLREVMTHKRQLSPVYVRLRIRPWLAGVEPALLNGFTFKELLARYPELTDNLLSVRESLFTVKPNNRQFPGVSGETVFALTAWDAEALHQTLLSAAEHTGDSLELIGPAERFSPGEFRRLHLDIRLPSEFFPDPRARLEEYLRGAYLPYSLRRERKNRLAFDLPAKALKRKILFGGFIEARDDGFLASLDAGQKFDLAALLGTFPGESLHRHARVSSSKIAW
ncbi:MAG: radical SAM protein [Anaerolineae bacterium]|nr:radical SAM protein [Anaerolineae bacterium]